MVRSAGSVPRRGRLLAATLLSAALLATLVPTTAGALSPPREPDGSVISNPGAVVLRITGGSISFGGIDVPLPECDPDGGRCLAMTADLAEDGRLRVQPGSLQLPALEAALDDLGLDLPVGLRVEAYTDGGIGGVLLPDAGLTRLDLGIGVRVVPDLSALQGAQFLSFLSPAALSCGVGPVRLSLTSAASGGLTGTPYDPATGTMSLVDGSYVVPPVTCSPLLLSVLQPLLSGGGGSFGGFDLQSLLGDIDLGSLLGSLGGALDGVDLGEFGLDGLGDLDLTSLDLRELLAGLNAALGLPAPPGASGTTLNISVERVDGTGPIEGGGERWPAFSFRDVTLGGEVEQAVRWLAANGITTGWGGDPTRFAPRGEITRGQMAAFLWRMMDRAGAPASCGFDDVSPTAFYATAVCWLKAEGITTGTNEAGDEFSPNDEVTRSQMARFLWRLAGEPEAPEVANFLDVSPTVGFAEAVDWLRAHGITTGMGGTNRFAAQGTVTRSQMAQFLHRLASRVGAWDGDAALPRTVDGDYRCLAIGVCPPVQWGDGGMEPGPGDSTEPGGTIEPNEPGGGWDDPIDLPGVIPDVVGMPELRAIDTLRAAGFAVRVVARDGRPLPVTMDFNPERVNLVVRGGLVVETRLG